jgi:tetrapyrrole methylase family protein/MazG family protein
MDDQATWAKLLDIMATLRGAQGCPWDKAQTHGSLKACLLEETYEVLDAIDQKNPQQLKEELGDLLLQVVFHAQIAREAGDFQMDEILEGLCDKLTRRHPHVFGDDKVGHPEEAIGRWEKIKAAERGPERSILSGVPSELPALLRAYRLGTKAARVGFDWPDPQGVLEKIHEETSELKASLQASDPRAVEEELGDLLFSIAQLARFLKVNPEEALRKCTQKFQRRFEWMEQKSLQTGKNFNQLNLEEMEKLWQQAKSSTSPV